MVSEADGQSCSGATRGRLIALEGIDGAGKTSVWERLQAEYGEDDDVVFTREPTESWYGDAVYRSVGDEDADPFAELFLYMADHADHLSRVIRPALDAGKVVITDRYIDSRIAYQAATLGADGYDGYERGVFAALGEIRELHDWFSVWPDVTLFLRVSPETAVERCAGANKFERKSHLETVASAYAVLQGMDSHRFTPIDTERYGEQEVAEKAVATVEGIREAVEG